MAGKRRDGREDARLVVTVRVTPRARRNAVALVGDGVRVWLMAPPVEGAANAALLALLAKHLRVPRRALTLLRGEMAREKVIAIEGMDAETFRQRLSSAAE